MDSFSWSDAARAVFGPCLHCLPSRRPPSDDEDQQQQRLGRWDELEGLLQNPGFSDGEMDSDALSLHSSVGQSGRGGGQRKKRRMKKKRKAKGSIRLFGYDLFGRPLHSDENEDDTGSRGGSVRRSNTYLSSSSLDSDPAPLTDDIIPRLSADQQAREDFEAAHRSKKERRKQKKLANLFVPSHEEFDGVPGSGPALPDDFGDFQVAPHLAAASGASMTSPPHAEADHGFVEVSRNGGDEADAAADFDAVSYTRGGSRRSDSGSGTRSRTSASLSNATPQDLLISPHLVPLPPSSAGSSSGRSKKKSKKSGKRSTTTGSTDTSSQLRSPTMPTPPPHVGIVSPSWAGHPAQEPEFEGVPADSDSFSNPISPTSPYKLTGQTVHGEMVPGFTSPQGFPTQGFGRGGVFPSAGLSGRKNSVTMSGAFLARTGDDA